MKAERKQKWLILAMLAWTLWVKTTTPAGKTQWEPHSGHDDRIGCQFTVAGTAIGASVRAGEREPTYPPVESSPYFEFKMKDGTIERYVCLPATLDPRPRN